MMVDGLRTRKESFMDISGATSFAAQEVATNKVQTGFDILTKTLQKSSQVAVSAEETTVKTDQRMEIAQQTGKGMNLDIKA